MTRQPTIILADDEPGLAASLRDALRGAGYKVTIATDGSRALQMAVRNRPDLLILNIDLVSRAGANVQEHKDRLKSLDAIPVIYLTADHTDGARLRAETSGAALLHKPLEVRQLRGTIERVLSRRAA